VELGDRRRGRVEKCWGDGEVRVLLGIVDHAAVSLSLSLSLSLSHSHSHTLSLSHIFGKSHQASFNLRSSSC
jgi:hypothetical protein